MPPNDTAPAGPLCRTLAGEVPPMKPNIVALVPMRHDSVRVPGKNYRPMAGKPLFRHIVDSLLACPLLTKVVIDTDSPTIVDQCRGLDRVKILTRPDHLRADTVPMNEVLLHDTAEVRADYYLQTHSTNPLLKPQTLTRAIETFLDNRLVYDSLFSVTRLQTRLWDPLARAVNHNPAILLRTQDLPPLYLENSCIYLFTRQTLVERRNRIGERPMMFEIDVIEGWDIDDEAGFIVAEALCRHLQQGN
jgi:CMP-N-acetylneuraminic acid synthetase